MMKRTLSTGLLAALVLSLTLGLSGCRDTFSLPRAKEPRSTAIASVLGVDRPEEAIKVFAISQGRKDQPPRCYVGEGPSFSEARLQTRDQGTETVSYAHVGHIIVSERAAAEQLERLLQYSLQNGEQSMESNLWLLREAEMSQVFSGELDISKRLDTLKTSGEAGTSLPPCTLRETAARLADDGVALIPALRWTGSDLVLAGYAICKKDTVVGYLEEDFADMTAILSGRSLFWNLQVKAEDGRDGTVQLHSGGCKVYPVRDQNQLLGLSLVCDVEGQLLEVRSQDEVSDLTGQVERKVAGDLGKTAALLQELDVDGAGLRRQAGLRDLRFWTDLSEQWDAVYGSLGLEVTVRARLTSGA
ncbi:MAG: Spore germination GerAC like, C-terminal [Firmicutes bacterium]|nr:Spore germination GerAC like, C-terminal [Bacillota bacterium]